LASGNAALLPDLRIEGIVRDQSQVSNHWVEISVRMQ
jgi:hypothetical protein